MSVREGVSRWMRVTLASARAALAALLEVIAARAGRHRTQVFFGHYQGFPLSRTLGSTTRTMNWRTACGVPSVLAVSVMMV